jgi:endonuclease-3
MPGRKPHEEQRFLKEANRRLLDAYGARSRAGEAHPTDELVATILSQHTSDTNSHRAFRNLKARFSSWDHLLGAPDSDVIDAIRSAGLANIKGPRIKQVLTAIKGSYGTLDLEFLRPMPVGDVKKILTALPGVGPKTAACVALFSLQMSAFPVDTHVQRIAVRLGLLDAREQPERFQELVEESMPENALLSLHLNLVRHGREVCRARSPLCSECVLLSICEFGRPLIEETSSTTAVA